MLIVPLQPVPSQTVNVTLADQACTINVRQLGTGLFVDLYVDDALVIGGVIAETNNVIVRSAYLGFTGDLAFLDTQGDGRTDPEFSGIGTRFFLAYLSQGELPAGVT